MNKIDSAAPAMRQARAAAIESDRRVEALATHVPVGIFQTDIEGNTVFVNSHCCNITGLSAAEAMGSGWASRLYPDDRERIQRAWQETLRAGRIPMSC